MGWFDLLSELTAIPGPTGQEDEVMHWCEERWAGKCQEITRSPTGNLYAKVGGTGRRVLMQAHADEIGFIVRSIDQDGFLHVATAQVRDDPAKRFPVGQAALVLAELSRGNVDVAEFSVGNPSLDEVFLALTGRTSEHEVPEEARP
jgi:hypothetical protein